MNSGQNIPSYNPINQDNKINILSDSLQSLCSKGPSYVPVPRHYNWLELELETEWKHYGNKESSYEKHKHSPPTKKPSQWRPLKTISHQLETFLSLVQNNLFTERLKKNVKDNLLKFERGSLNEWRKNNLFNKNSNLVKWSLDKGNRFFVVDKKTDWNKAQCLGVHLRG